MNLRQYLPCLDWAERYHRHAFISDLTAAIIVTVLLIPQSLAYALLAGLILPSLQVNMRAGHFPPSDGNSRLFLSVPLNAFGGENLARFMASK